MGNDTVHALRDQVANLRAELANLKARRVEDMAQVEKVLKERDEAVAAALAVGRALDEFKCAAKEHLDAGAALLEAVAPYLGSHTIPRI